MTTARRFRPTTNGTTSRPSISRQPSPVRPGVLTVPPPDLLEQGLDTGGGVHAHAQAGSGGRGRRLEPGSVEFTVSWLQADNNTGVGRHTCQVSRSTLMPATNMSHSYSVTATTGPRGSFESRTTMTPGLARTKICDLTPGRLAATSAARLPGAEPGRYRKAASRVATGISPGSSRDHDCHRFTDLQSDITLLWLCHESGKWRERDGGKRSRGCRGGDAGGAGQ